MSPGGGLSVVTWWTGWVTLVIGNSAPLGGSETAPHIFKIGKENVVKKKIQFRRSAKHFMETSAEGKVSIRGAFTIDVLNGGKWLPLGDENGILEFSSKEARDAEIERLKVVVS